MTGWLLALPVAALVPALHPDGAALAQRGGRLVRSAAPRMAMADLLRDAKLDLPWLAEGDAPASNKINVPEHVKEILRRPDAPTRTSESSERVDAVRARAATAASDAADLRGMLVGEEDKTAWWRTPPTSPRQLTKEAPLRVLVAGGGLAGLVTAAACHAKGMEVAIFEQASSYAPYGGPIQIQSNALRALQRCARSRRDRRRIGPISRQREQEHTPPRTSTRSCPLNFWCRINPKIYDELIEAGTVTADRVSGLKIGYRKGNKLAGLYDRGDWLGETCRDAPEIRPASLISSSPRDSSVRHDWPGARGWPAGDGGGGQAGHPAGADQARLSGGVRPHQVAHRDVRGP